MFNKSIASVFNPVKKEEQKPSLAAILKTPGGIGNQNAAGPHAARAATSEAMSASGKAKSSGKYEDYKAAAAAHFSASHVTEGKQSKFHKDQGMAHNVMAVNAKVHDSQTSSSHWGK